LTKLWHSWAMDKKTGLLWLIAICQ